MKGKWAKGIAPRFFAWIIKDKLAVSERPGGYARNHRRVRRQEEILWLRGEGFTRVVSLLTSPHNLHAYDELDMAWAHIPFGPHDDPYVVLPDLFGQLREWMNAGERLLVHQEELGDRLMGVVAGYLRWSGLVPAGPQAISVVERIMHRQMGPDGRELVALAPQLAGAGGCVGTIKVRGRTSEESPPRIRETVPAKAAAAEVALLLADDALVEVPDGVPPWMGEVAVHAMADVALAEAPAPAVEVSAATVNGAAPAAVEHGAPAEQEAPASESGDRDAPDDVADATPAVDAPPDIAVNDEVDDAAPPAPVDSTPTEVDEAQDQRGEAPELPSDVARDPEANGDGEFQPD